MDKIIKILNKKIYIREIIMLVFIVLSLLYLSIYTSFAIFEKTVEKVGAVVFEASEVILSIFSEESSYVIDNSGNFGTITVEAGTTKSFDLTIKNETPIDVKYKTWYRFTSGVTILDVEVGISSNSESSNTSTLTKKGTDGSEKTITAIIVNNSTQDATIDIGVQGGYANNEVVLSSGNGEMVTITGPESYQDESGANQPLLADGMIPVVYDETNDVWVKADITEKWYDYNEQWWANAVTTTSENRATYLSDEHVGQEIPMDEINSMWVWIPRFRYNIPNNIAVGTEYSPITNPPQINVIFETNTETNGVTEVIYRNNITNSGINTNYYTHPSFRNVENIIYSEETLSRGAWDEEITGFWVAKFEVGTSTTTCVDKSTCTDVEPIIKPDVTSLRSQNVSTQFLTSLKFANGTMNSTTGAVTFAVNANNIYGLNTLNATTDTHMMKNTEWGAVAILSQSQYGKMGNSNYTGTNKEIYKNDTTDYYTGRSSGLPSTTGSTTNGTYSYNDKSCTTVTTTDLGNTCTGSKEINAGQGASTTGNIYGIYDMSGGSVEITMGNWMNYSGKNTDYNSGFTGPNDDGSTTLGISFPEKKYYDLYNAPSSIYITKEQTIMGDTTWETMSWYSDNAVYGSTSYPWAIRGGDWRDNVKPGVFYTSGVVGNANTGFSWRAILIP